MSRLPLTEPEISKMAERLGRMLLKLPVVSGIAGHRKPEYTVKDYLRATNKDAEFLIDLFSRPTPEILLKWYPRIEMPEGTIFSFPEVSASGGPGAKEMLEAKKALERMGEEPADY